MSLFPSPAAADPRASLPPETGDIRPIIDRPRKGLSGTAIAAIALVFALGLFGVLEAHRHNATAPATAFARSEITDNAALPPLYVPPVAAAPLVPQPEPRLVTKPAPVAPVTPSNSPSYGAPAIAVTEPMPYANASPSSPGMPSPIRQIPRSVGGQAMVVDASTPSTAGAEQQPEEAGGKASDTKHPTLSTTRARAAMLANRSTTVPQGTLIPAVLETAFDSTSPGFARALVQKNIHGFDGTQILIPRGSRLIGEYGSDIARGQGRAVILWLRLIRPDGVTIAIGSPAADTLGRGGVKADVNSHFLERFGTAILQSALDVGVNLAARNSRSPVIVALPGSSSAITVAATARTTDVTPTLRVPAGRSVSVFVARDLDFTTTGGVR